MVTHLGTETIIPLWCRPDDDVPIDEQRKRIKKFRAALDSAESDCTSIVHLCELWEGKEIYKHFSPTWDEFCLEWIQVQPTDIDRLCQGLQKLRAQGVEGGIPAAQALAADDTVKSVLTQKEAGALGGRGNKAPYDIRSFVEEKSQYGTATPYLVKRLKRDAPDIAAALARGEYPSARAAAKAAGMTLDRGRVWLSADPTKAAHTLRQKYDTEYLQALIHSLQEQLHA